MKQKHQTLVLLEIGLDGEPPTEFRIFRAGINKTRKGNLLFDDEAARMTMAAYHEHGADIMIDWNHASVSMVLTDPKLAGAAAGFANLEVRNQELWAVNVRWNEDGAEALRKKRYRYFSPTLYSDDESGRIEEIVNIALTNLPATDHQTPLVAASISAPGAKKEGKKMKELLKKLGLREDASEPEAVVALEKERAMLLSVTGSNDIDSALGVVRGWKAAADKLPTVEAEMTKLHAQHAAREREALLKQYAAKFSPAELDGWVKAASIEMLSEYVKTAPDRVTTIATPQKDPNVIALSEHDKEEAKKFGISEAAYLEALRSLRGE